MKKLRTGTLHIASHQMTPYIMAFIIFSLLCSYVFFANSAVRNVTKLEQSKNVIQNLRMKVSELESNQFIAQNTVNIETASHIGLVEVVNPVYIMRDSAHSGLSLKR